ncbi:XrtA system polysaccharide deacetylase [Microcystis aeruginosa]|uniref:Polysaccharide deacetylase n=1 Tax=Microcystis aeruginosa PCC 9701 TaxID=721123 RepID=I4ISW7_MICAE|nr:XrtA system polysaccharide deacetylase [Microcystis aeruginosa]CCI37391.1 Polysaccharide deacetylase [Microcystis aeruginosa PCC 9701]
MLNALTFDVEDYFQVESFTDIVSREDWSQYPIRVVENTQRILNLLREYKTHATFFVLGWVADRYPELVQEIAADGHEIATHGYWHQLIYRQTPEEFATDLENSLEAIQKALGSYSVVGYRAPVFSITNQSLWALDILQKHGIKYDSSIFPVAVHDRYGISNADRFANEIGEGLWEFPPSTVQLGKRNLPVAGGGYFRLFPLPLTRWAIRQINAEGQPAVIYLHPWEFDPEQPRISGASLLSRFRHYLNLEQTESRLRKLLEEFQFGSMSQVFSPQLSSN